MDAVDVQEALTFVQKVPTTGGGSLYEHLTKLVAKVRACGTALLRSRASLTVHSDVPFPSLRWCAAPPRASKPPARVLRRRLRSWSSAQATPLMYWRRRCW
jgi:hypothetical protein